MNAKMVSTMQYLFNMPVPDTLREAKVRKSQINYGRVACSTDECWVVSNVTTGQIVIDMKFVYQVTSIIGIWRVPNRTMCIGIGTN